MSENSVLFHSNLDPKPRIVLDGHTIYKENSLNESLSSIRISKVRKTNIKDIKTRNLTSLQLSELVKSFEIECMKFAHVQMPGAELQLWSCEYEVQELLSSKPKIYKEYAFKTKCWYK